MIDGILFEEDFKRCYQTMPEYDVEIDASGLNCPLPVLKARKALNGMNAGQKLHLIVTDPGANKDIPAFCKMTGNELLETQEEEGKIFFVMQKGTIDG